MTWESLYNFFGIKDFIYLISSSQLQDMLFPIKLIFIFFTIFYFVAVVYFMLNSSWLQYKFLEDVTEFFLWQSYGQRQMQKQWDKIVKRTESGAESDYKLAIIDADDLLEEVLDNRGYDGDTFEEALKEAGKLISDIVDDVLRAHNVRNSIVYNPDYKITASEAKKILDIYESAVKGIGLG